MSVQFLQLLEKYLDLASTRHTLVSTNIANIDTPGYRTRDVDFRGELAHFMNDTGTSFDAVARPVSGLLERPDGNNVSMDREALALSESQVQFQIGVQLIRREFNRLLNAINEDKS